MNKDTSLRLMYDMLLATSAPKLLDELKKTPDLYEQAFNNWLDKTIDEAISEVAPNKEKE